MNNEQFQQLLCSTRHRGIIRRINFHRFSVALFLLTSCLVLTPKVCADDFHVWLDNAGRKHISTIPPHGFTADGALRRAYDPNSLVAQHHAMRKTLNAQSVQIAAQQAERERLESKPEVTASEAVVRAPKEGIMGLSDLIKLERRGGRYIEKR